MWIMCLAKQFLSANMCAEPHIRHGISQSDDVYALCNIFSAVCFCLSEFSLFVV